MHPKLAEARLGCDAGEKLCQLLIPKPIRSLETLSVLARFALLGSSYWLVSATRFWLDPDLS